MSFQTPQAPVGFTYGQVLVAMVVVALLSSVATIAALNTPIPAWMY